MIIYEVTQLDSGQLMLAHQGDVIALSDPNHPRDDLADKRDFAIMCAALNLVEAVRRKVI